MLGQWLMEMEQHTAFGADYQACLPDIFSTGTIEHIRIEPTMLVQNRSCYEREIEGLLMEKPPMEIILLLK